MGEAGAWQTPRPGLEDRTLRQMEACLQESFAARMKPGAWEVIKEEGGRMLSFKIREAFPWFAMESGVGEEKSADLREGKEKIYCRAEVVSVGTISSFSLRRKRNRGTEAGG